MQMHLLELVYIPAIRLFQRYKTMNANTSTASNGPITNYHCIVALAEKKKKQKQNQINQINKNKKVPSYYRSTENEECKQNKVVFF